MKKNNHGFTLVELIAVLVVLIIVFLIAINKVNDLMDKSEKRSLEADALTYIKAVNNHATIVNGDSLDAKFEGPYSVSELNTLGIKISGTKPTSGYILSRNSKTVSGCLNYDNYKVVIKDEKVSKVSKGSCNLKDGYNSVIGVYLADYTGEEEIFTIPKTGIYLIEAWGAQGGSASNEFKGGFGGYSRGQVYLEQGVNLYINVGGTGASKCLKKQCAGGYNGGSTGGLNDGNLGNIYYSGGGGASSVAYSTGLVKDLENTKDNILIIAGGGGGATYINETDGVNGASGGGALGGEGYDDTANIYKGYGGSQTSPGSYNFPNCTEASFGKAGAVTSRSSSYAASGSGGGYYGGGCGGAGGSGYIGNTELTEKAMYCYDCRDNIKIESRTIETKESSKVPMAYTPKQGHGYVRISFVQEIDDVGPSPTSKSFIHRGSTYTYTVPQNGNYKLQVWGAQGGNSGTAYIGGYGAYAEGVLTLSQGDKLYVNVGSQGGSDCATTDCTGGYNGGGKGQPYTGGDTSNHVAGGGGATSIAGETGVLTAITDKTKIYIVAGGGSGAYYHTSGGAGYSNNGSSGGGYQGKNGATCSYTSQYAGGGTQSAGGTAGYRGGPGSFGLGGTYPGGSSGGGGGYYGGGSAAHAGAGGGSGYIGYNNLSNKVMYCYNCDENDSDATKTVSTTCINEMPVDNCAKIGNGYAKISLIE